MNLDAIVSEVRAGAYLYEVGRRIGRDAGAIRRDLRAAGYPRFWRGTKPTFSDTDLISLIGQGLSQSEAARRLAVQPAAVCLRLKRIRERGVRPTS